MTIFGSKITYLFTYQLLHPMANSDQALNKRSINFQPPRSRFKQPIIPLEPRLMSPLSPFSRQYSITSAPKIHHNSITRHICPFIHSQVHNIPLTASRLLRRSTHEDKTQRQKTGRKKATDGVQRRPARQTEERIRRKSLPNRKTSPRARQRARTERSANKNLVPKQTSENQKSQRYQKSARLTTHGAGIIQSQYVTDV